MDIINHLSRTVTPAVLGDQRTPQSEGLLEQFYAIFSARLADQDTYGRFAGQEIARDDLGFYDRVWTDETHRSSIARELAAEHNLDEASVQKLTAAAAPLAYLELSELAGSTPVPQFLRDNLSTYRSHIPAWAGAVIPAGLLAAEPAGTRISDTVSTAPLQREEEPSGSFMKALLPIIGLIILGALAWALLRGCQDKDRVEPVATPAVVEETVVEEATPVVATDVDPAALRISSGDGNTLYACHIDAGNDELQNNILAAVRGVFGDEADKCRSDVDDNFAVDMPAAASLPAILQLIKAVPDASAIIKGDTVTVNSPDAATLEKLVADIQAAAPDLQVVAEGPLDLTNEIANSVTAADTAMDRLGDNPDPRDVARALSLQVINFQFDKAFIPDVNKPVLDRAAKIIQEVPDMHLMIIGHTDNKGTDAYNKNLSRERAQAVKDYLVEQGVDPSKLTTKGMGEHDPIADNATDQGRFHNRRIEFTVYDESQMPGDGTVGDGIAVNDDASKVDTVALPDPDLNPLDANNDDLLPDSDDPTQGTVLDPNANN
ncbi:OmpA family protein [Psychrobacter sp. I-STPA10]|uniref:OmpA family protein n=1 Tax=Psychrobacter sp. I-STPA10 TaxID=2585769 RepID=UPI001E5B629C|nr:OmpA family protein [Psychrobacter sp. I-STPA10]